MRAGFVVLTDRYIFSIMARAIARGEDTEWIERVCGFGLVPHAVFYLRARVKDLVIYASGDTAAWFAPSGPFNPEITVRYFR